MKKFFKKIAFVSALAMVISSMPAQNAKAEDDINMYPTLKMYLGADESDDFPGSRYAKVWGHREAGYTVKFASDNEEVATVTENKGLVTAKKVGTATVTATFSKEGAEDVVKTCKVTVKNHAVEAGVSDASADKLKNLTVGEKITLKTYRTDANGVTSWKGKDVITDGARFASSDPNVFTVTKKGGFVKAIGAGEATLSVWAVQSEGATKADGKVVEYKATTAKKTYPVKVENHKRVELSANSYKLDADGAASTIINFTLYKADGSIDKETTNVQVTFSATRGTMAFADVTLENGEAHVLYTSPILDAPATALIQATVTGAGENGQDLINLRANPVEIELVPSMKESGIDAESGAKVVSAIATTADRVTLYFDKKITPAVFKKADGSIDSSKFTFELDDQISPNTTEMASADITNGNIQYIIQGGSEYALTFVFYDKGVNKKLLTDNTKFAVKFTDNRNASAPVYGRAYNYVTDAVSPKVLAVKPLNLKQIEVTFSEPISAETVASQFAIDGYALDDSEIVQAPNKWGVSGHRATVARNEKGDLALTRNVFTITLGKSYNDQNVLRQNYFKAGVHSMTAFNIKDHAGESDSANVVASQTLDFVIVANEDAPKYTVEVQSPEQIKITFNCLLEDESAALGALHFLYYDEVDKAYKDLNVGGSLGLVNYYDIVNITNGGSVSKFLIEVRDDWTQVVKNNNNELPSTKVLVKNTNYYNYKFKVELDANEVANAANGRTNAAAIPVDLSDNAVLQTVDATAPTIVKDIEEKDQGVKFEVTFSEPVQISNAASGSAAASKVGNITPSTLQIAGVPETTVYIVSADLKETHVADIIDINRENNVVTIGVRNGTLKASTKYMLYVRNASDDIGNAANTLTKEFTTKGVSTTPTGEFKISYVKADTSLDFATGVTALTPYSVADMNYDAIYVKFTKDFAKAGGVATVLTNTNWSINGAALPAGTVITTGIIGETSTAQNPVYGVTIILPNGTITDINKTVVTLSNTVCAADGKETLKGENRVVTQYVAP